MDNNLPIETTVDEFLHSANKPIDEEMKAFERELSAPRQTATDTPDALVNAQNDEAEKTPVEKPSFFSLAPAPAPTATSSSPVASQPMFPNAPDEMEEAAQEEEEKNKDFGKLASGKAEKKLRVFLNVRDKAQQRIFAAWSDADRELFAMDEEDFELLTDAYMPIMEEHGGKIPWWLDIALVESIVLGSKIQLARKLAKVNKENETLRSDNSALQKAVANSVPVTSKDRKKFSIDENGYYTHSATGTYIKQARRMEKASLKDIDKIVEVNDSDFVKSAFKLSDSEIAKLYPNE